VLSHSVLETWTKFNYYYFLQINVDCISMSS